MHTIHTYIKDIYCVYQGYQYTHTSHHIQIYHAIYTHTYVYQEYTAYTWYAHIKVGGAAARNVARLAELTLPPLTSSSTREYIGSQGVQTFTTHSRT